MSLKSTLIPGSEVGGDASGFPIADQLDHQNGTFDWPDLQVVLCLTVLNAIVIQDSVLGDEEIVLIDIYLNTAGASVEVLQCFGAVLSSSQRAVRNETRQISRPSSWDPLFGSYGRIV